MFNRSGSFWDARRPASGRIFLDAVRGRSPFSPGFLEDSDRIVDREEALFARSPFSDFSDTLHESPHWETPEYYPNPVPHAPPLYQRAQESHVGSLFSVKYKKNVGIKKDPIYVYTAAVGVGKTYSPLLLSIYKREMQGHKYVIFLVHDKEIAHYFNTAYGKVPGMSRRLEERAGIVVGRHENGRLVIGITPEKFRNFQVVMYRDSSSGKKFMLRSFATYEYVKMRDHDGGLYLASQDSCKKDIASCLFTLVDGKKSEAF